MSSTQLWYDRPATEWTDALPLGNGRLGLMVHGGRAIDHIQINDGTAWSGSPRSEQAEPVVSSAAAAEALAAARAAVADERFDDASAALQRLQHRHTQAYVAFADLDLLTDIPDAVGSGAPDGYRRMLDLQTATHTVSFTTGGTRITRETFVSHPHGVAIIRIHAEGGDGLALSLRLRSELRVLDTQADAQGGSLALRLPSNVSPPFDADRPAVEYSEDPTASMTGVLVVRWEHDGIPAVDGIAATGVSDATIYLATDTTFRGIAREPEGTTAAILERAEQRIAAARAAGLPAVQDAQRADHRRLFDRVTIETGADPDLPTDERLRRGNADPAGVLAADPALAALLYQYGRYLLIGSSRRGGLPANLQGIWNDRVQPPWSGNYTTNINVEMNYWPAEVAQLSECAEPLFDLIEALEQTGPETAARLYAAPGWVAHHNTDPWGYTQPVGWGTHDPRWAFWPLAGAWLVRHLWEHLEFGADDAFALRAWKIVRPAAEFALHWLIEQADGTLGTSPSTSPENVFTQPSGVAGSVDASSTLDLVLIADLMRFTIALADRVGEGSDEIVERAREARTRIPSPTIGRDGMVPEWRADRPQFELDHRHVSHLYFAFPGDTDLDPDLRDAVSASLDGRGDEATGWSLAWKVALRARLRQPAAVSDVLRLVYRDMEVDRGDWIGGLYRNLFVAHPPFQIDGNFGFVAGLTECLLQSHARRIDLLPAVPRELSRGSVSGIVARPGVEVALAWQPDVRGDAELVVARFRGLNDSGSAEHVVTLGERSTTIDLRGGASVTLDRDLVVVDPVGAV